jgi:hypothetical protein
MCAKTTTGIISYIRYSGSGDSNFRYNADHKDYLLVLECSTASTLREWELRNYYNAGAIVAILRQIANEPLSHLSGLFRELNIPVFMVRKMDAGKFEECAHCPSTQFRVYANEFAGEGKIWEA